MIPRVERTNYEARLKFQNDQRHDRHGNCRIRLENHQQKKWAVSMIDAKLMAVLYFTCPCEGRKPSAQNCRRVTEYIYEGVYLSDNTTQSKFEARIICHGEA